MIVTILLRTATILPATIIVIVHLLIQLTVRHRTIAPRRIIVHLPTAHPAITIPIAIHPIPLQVTLTRIHQDIAGIITAINERK